MKCVKISLFQCFFLIIERKFFQENYFFQNGHEAFGDMAVLQHHPSAVFYAFVDKSLGDDALSLTEGQRKQPAGAEALIIGEFQQNRHRIRAGRQNEYQRDAGVRVRVRGHQVKGRRLNELTSQLLCQNNKKKLVTILISTFFFLLKNY